MKKKNIAVLLTCHNRKNKTLSCLASLYEATIPPDYKVDVFLMDDGSYDGTAEVVKSFYPNINILKGDGSLFWAGGMRHAWTAAIESSAYDYFLLINDDVILKHDFLLNLLIADEYSYEISHMGGVYSGVTVDSSGGRITYGGSRVKNYLFVLRFTKLFPSNSPQVCDITNANVLLVSSDVVDKIGIFDNRFTHGIADYDYSLKAKDQKIPVLLAPGICGVCEHDHGKSWKSQKLPLRERIAYLKSPKGLAYSEYMYFVRKNFPLYLPYAFIMLWAKTLFPIMWDRLKKVNYANV